MLNRSLPQYAAVSALLTFFSVRSCCTFCTSDSTHARKDATGATHRSCPDHQSDLEAFVRDLNEWHSEVTP